MTKVFGPVFLVSSSVTNIKEYFKGVHKLTWKQFWNLKEHFLGPKSLLKTQSLEK